MQNMKCCESEICGNLKIIIPICIEVDKDKLVFR